MYSTLDSPCLNCQKKKIGVRCIKVWGPVKQQTSISRPPPTPIDQVIEPENVMLLQYLYNDPPVEFYFADAVFYLAKQMRQLYTSSITSSSLRHALLLFADVVRRQGNINPLGLRNASLARQSLFKNARGRLDQGDLAAAVVLAAVAFTMILGWCGLENTESYLKEATVHMKGTEPILVCLSNDVETEPHNSVLATIWPPMRDMILYFSSLLQGPLIFRTYYRSRKLPGPFTWASFGPYFRDPVRLHYGIRLIETIAIRAVDAKLKSCGDSTDEQCENIAVGDARAALDDMKYHPGMFAITADEYRRFILLPVALCRVLFSLRDTSNVLSAWQDPVVREATSSLYQSVGEFTQSCHSWDASEFDHLHLQRAVSLLSLVFPVSFDMMSLISGNCEHPSVLILTFYSSDCRVHVNQGWVSYAPSDRSIQRELHRGGIYSRGEECVAFFRLMILGNCFSLSTPIFVAILLFVRIA